MADSQNMPARTRPSVVTISTYLLLLFAVCQLIGLIVTVVTIGAVRDAMEEAFRDTGADGVDNIADAMVFLGIGSAAFLLVVSLALAGLGLMNLRGKNGARIATWVVGGIMLCCTGFGVLGGLTSGINVSGESSGDVPSADELQRRLDEALPSWANPVTNLLNVIMLIALLAALILLAMPKANEFFRNPAPQQWEPPMPGGSFPGQPGYPPAPGYPPTPGYPPAPGYPGAPQQPGYPGAAQQPGYPGAPQQSGYPGGASEPGYPPTSDQPGTPGQPSFGEQSGGQGWQNPPAGGPEQSGGQTPPTDRPG